MSSNVQWRHRPLTVQQTSSDLLRRHRATFNPSGVERCLAKPNANNSNTGATTFDYMFAWHFDEIHKLKNP